ncbi:MAG: hypothetical protein EOO96_04545 [Pedobacter sp.]|nr:MAG: hypothetical protein EOO96_04545 [Pedobacter sp.]
MKKILLFIASVMLLGLIYNYYPEPELAKDASIDSLVVDKSENRMIVFEQGKLLKTYKVSFGANPVGHKEFEGDEKTPEGIYIINDKNPNSGYYKNLGVSYPNKADMENAKKVGKPAGGDIKIHGLRNGIGFIHKFQRWFNWTNGCIALTNNEVDELYSSVKIGARINIKP